MPTINEVWEQAQLINANLATVHDDLTGITQRADEANDWLQNIRQLTADGLASVSLGIIALEKRQDLANQALFHLLQQQDTVICNLEKISRNTCLFLNEAVKQTAFQEKMATALEALQYMYETTNPASALAYARHVEDIQRIEKCCPPPKPNVPCAYDICPVPKPIREPELPDYPRFQPKQPDIHRVNRNVPR